MKITITKKDDSVSKYDICLKSAIICLLTFSLTLHHACYALSTPVAVSKSFIAPLFLIVGYLVTMAIFASKVFKKNK